MFLLIYVRFDRRLAGDFLRLTVETVQWTCPQGTPKGGRDTLFPHRPYVETGHPLVGDPPRPSTDVLSYYYFLLELSGLVTRLRLFYFNLFLFTIHEKNPVFFGYRIWVLPPLSRVFVCEFLFCFVLEIPKFEFYTVLFCLVFFQNPR